MLATEVVRLKVGDKLVKPLIPSMQAVVTRIDEKRGEVTILVEGEEERTLRLAYLQQSMWRTVHGKDE